ncbi:MAG: tetratricopeptide repeat protein [Myxococcota bacterium]|nr:tetratricopeptide repeat protein [Myxococcota bacterium]
MARQPRARRAPRGVSFVLLSMIAASVPASTAGAQGAEGVDRELTAIEGQTRALLGEPLRREGLRSPTHVEERLTDGELFYRLQDYVRASIIFTDIVENFPNHAAYPDALFLLADSLFRAGDYLGARTRFREVLAHSGEPLFRPFIQRSLGRLIEIAIHTRDFEGIDEVFAQLNRLPPSEIEAATTYFRAKYLYNRAVPTEDVLRAPTGSQDTGHPQVQGIDLAALDRAREAFEAVQEGSPYYPQARYFVGVIYTLREQYPQAIEAFTRVLRAPATTEEHVQIAEMTQLALGRLYYETDQLEQAVEAYQAIPRTSSNFDEALYEIAWVYIRMGDATRAERALEVLGVAAPDSQHIPDAKILRGNLLLRNGRYEEANRVFREVAREFGPVRRELDEMLAEHDDPRAYFRQLVRENMESFDANAFLPPLAQRWAGIEGDMDRALGVLSDLAEARQLVQETSQLVQRLTAALSQPNGVAVFADLRRQRELTTGIRNRLIRLRRQAIGAESSSGGSAELEAVRSQRREIERFIDRMPTSDEDFASMDGAVLSRYRRLERELARMEVELLGMEARIVATDRYLGATEGTRDASGDAAVRTELTQQRQAVADYRDEIQQLRILLEAGRLQVGVGDDRYARHERLRAEHARLVAQERQLGGGSTRLDPLFRRMASVESQLDTRDAEIDRIVQERTAAIRAEVDEESARIAGYRAELESLESEAEVVVGAVTHDNFRRVQARFYDLVLRADVGRIDVSWAEREEHRMRVEMLTRERSQELRRLDDDFREITDEGGGAPGAAASDDAGEESTQ